MKKPKTQSGQLNTGEEKQTQKTDTTQLQNLL